MIFGVWPSVVQGDLVDLTPPECLPEDTDQTEKALAELQGGHGPFHIRCYRHFGPGVKRHSDATPTPPDPARCIDRGRLIDLVACYQSSVPNPDGFAEFVRQAVRDVASWGGGKVQVGEELNVPAPLDGSSPGCLPAIAAGVSAALDERTMHGVDVEVGVNTAGLADPVFWTKFADAIGPAALSQLNYIGLDMFPDILRSVSEEKLAVASQLLIEKLRTATRHVGVSEHVPIHITEPAGLPAATATRTSKPTSSRPSRKPSSVPARSASTNSSGSGTDGPSATTGASDSGSCMTITHPNRPTKSYVDSSRLNSP